MSKSPYELRTELLSMAMQILLEEKRAQASKLAQETGTTLSQPIEAPTTEEVIAEARKLNNFIQTK